MSEADKGPPPLEAVDPSGAASSAPPPEKKKRAASTQNKAVSTGRKKKKAAVAVVPEPPNVVNRTLTKKLYCVLCYKGATLSNARWGLCRSCQTKMGTVKDQ